MFSTTIIFIPSWNQLRLNPIALLTCFILTVIFIYVNHRGWFNGKVYGQTVCKPPPVPLHAVVRNLTS